MFSLDLPAAEMLRTVTYTIKIKLHIFHYKHITHMQNTPKTINYIHGTINE